MKNSNTFLILYSVLALTYPGVSLAIPEQEEDTFFTKAVRVTEIVVSGAHGSYSGGDPFHAPTKDLERYSSGGDIVYTKSQSKESASSFYFATVRATEISVSGSYGTHTGGDPFYAATEDIEHHTSRTKLLTDQERLEELEKETKALRQKLEQEEEEKESAWWKGIKSTFSAVKETVGIVGVVLGIVVAVIALI